MRATVWTVANALGVVAGTPGELLTALLDAPRRPDRVVLPAGPPGVRELVDDLRALGHVRVALEGPAPARPAREERPRLSDPYGVCAADPVRVTRAYEDDPAAHGGLRAAWLRAGQALVRDGQTPADRALALLAALPGDAAAHLRGELAALAADAPWTVAGVREGRVTALTVCGGRPVETDDPRTRAVACLDDGTRLTLDERGRLRTPASPVPRLVEAVAATLATHPATALAAVGDTVLGGDRMGSVHAFSLSGLHQAALHSGRVTALTATAGPRVYSGGADGTVRAWRPGGAAGGTPVVARRPHPVAALHARGPVLAVAWADGLVELRDPRARAVRRFRPGPAVRAVAVLPDGSLAVGTDTACVRLRPV
ncbi:WD40 repeat domain-containing protein [Streptomyces roseolilacinus]|uniref:WD40 repeat domain-containing protein n=1 Tax=Streptomyces roseolilacinus TaxID=66904 RepID=UPI00381FDCDB